MRWTQTLIPTLKETPADAEILSHKLLLRAGLIRKLTGGLYTFLPLGAARAAQDRANRPRGNGPGRRASKSSCPRLQPPEIWQQSGRYETAADVLYKVRDRAKKEWVLGPDARGSHHHAGGRRNQFLPATAEEFLPDPGQVPG